MFSWTQLAALLVVLNSVCTFLDWMLLNRDKARLLELLGTLFPPPIPGSPAVRFGKTPRFRQLAFVACVSATLSVISYYASVYAIAGLFPHETFVSAGEFVQPRRLRELIVVLFIVFPLDYIALGRIGRTITGTRASEVRTIFWLSLAIYSRIAVQVFACAVFIMFGDWGAAAIRVTVSFPFYIYYYISQHGSGPEYLLLAPWLLSVLIVVPFAILFVRFAIAVARRLAYSMQEQGFESVKIFAPLGALLSLLASIAKAIESLAS